MDGTDYSSLRELLFTKDETAELRLKKKEKIIDAYTLTLVKKGRYTKSNKAHPVDLLNADDNADVEAIGQALRRFEAENPMPEECLQRA